MELFEFLGYLYNPNISGVQISVSTIRVLYVKYVYIYYLNIFINKLFENVIKKIWVINRYSHIKRSIKSIKIIPSTNKMYI